MSRMHRFLHLIVITTFLSSQCWGWGQKGHETVNDVAVQLLPKSSLSKLLRNNLAAVRFMAMVPDKAWKHGTTPHPPEAHAHFFQVDGYAPRGGQIPQDINQLIAKFGIEKVVENGHAPWRMQQLSILLVKALKRPTVSPDEVIQIASTLGHYVGDLGNPLHVTKDYDGQSLGLKGLHSYFETQSVKNIPDGELEAAVAEKAQVFLKNIPNNVTPLDAAFRLAYKGHEKTQVVINAAKRMGKTPSFQKAMIPTIVTTLSMSAAVLAKIWNEAYVLAGSPDLETENRGRIEIPNWIPVTYLNGASALFSQSQQDDDID